jgi:hypothetical protein
MNRLSNDRNGTTIFASRARKNLDFIVAHGKAGHDDVHPVTQAVSALLGIVVFPWETSAFDHMKKEKLPILTTRGWPKWAMTGTRRVVDLKDLIYVLRNSIAHGSIEFDSDSSDPSRVAISFANIPEGARDADWVGTIRGDQLIEFCRHFSAAIEEEAG